MLFGRAFIKICTVTVNVGVNRKALPSPAAAPGRPWLALGWSVTCSHDVTTRLIRSKSVRLQGSMKAL